MGRLAVRFWRARSNDRRQVLCRQISSWQWPRSAHEAVTLSKAGKITPDEARALAKKTLGSVAHGADPAAQRAAVKRATTLAEAAEQFLIEHVEAKRSASSATSYRDLLERWHFRNRQRKAEKVTTAEVQRLHSKNAHTPYQANRFVGRHITEVCELFRRHVAEVCERASARRPARSECLIARPLVRHSGPIAGGRLGSNALIAHLLKSHQ